MSVYMSRFKSISVRDKLSEEEIAKLQELKRKAQELFGEGELFCVKCGCHFVLLEPFTKNASKSYRCSNPKCNCIDAKWLNGWAYYLKTLLAHKNEL